MIETAIEEIATGWKDDLATLNWFKTYAQYSKNSVVRSAAVKQLGKHWKDEFNVFEILAKCAVVDPFRSENNSQINPRQTALEVMTEQYPDYPQTRSLVSDRAENDADEQVREFAKEKLTVLES
ncbi:MAG: hypothetical protein F6K10_25895 [Moorea sp. SIO2B7]|nr:hypothetical protein [Moorena sp. SIO2B7]